MSCALQVQADSALRGPERLARLYAGEVFLDAPRPATREVVRFLWRCLRQAYPEDDPRQAQFRLPPAEHFRRLTALRREVLQSPETRFLLREVLLAAGFALERTWFDLLRVRAVTSGGHRNAAAAHAYLVHRDTWYANPPAQVNVWIAVSDVSSAEAFAFWPWHWDRPIANDSQVFDYERWLAYGGWQAPDPRKLYPRALEPPQGPAVQLPAASGSCLWFSGTHLHGTRPHDSGRTRFSVEFRIVVQDDLRPLAQARRLDSRAHGSTLGDFLRASDFAPFPADLARRWAGPAGVERSARRV